MASPKSDWETELKNRHFAKNFYNEEELKNILISLVKTFSSLQKRGISINMEVDPHKPRVENRKKICDRNKTIR